MASNNIILAVPSANSSVNYDLPQSESAKLSFGPEDIDGLKLNSEGGLDISFVAGGHVTLTNFQSFIDNGNTLSLADGTQVDPKVLFNALGGQHDNPFPASDVTKIGIPAENAQHDIALKPGEKYLFNFDLSETSGADVKDGKMVIGFANGGKIVLTNYDAAMADKNPPELSLASKTCVVKGDELITNIKELAKANPLDGTVVVLDDKKEEEATKHKSKIAHVEMDGKNDTGVIDKTGLGYDAKHHKGDGEVTSDADGKKAAQIVTAAGDDSASDIARQLANIATAAGGAAGGRANSGYGYNSRPSLDPFLTNPDIGPINPTALRYTAPLLPPSTFIIENDSNPLAIRPDAQLLDETNLKDGPLTASGHLNIDYGADGPGGVSSNGSFTSGGSETGGVLSSNGHPITVTVVGNDYIGTDSEGHKVFELDVNPSNGDYTYTQYLPFDHANGNDPNDQISLNFGVTAKDGDGDAVSTTIQIVVADDAPSISGASGTVDETDLKKGPLVSTGDLSHSYGQDGAGHIQTTGTFAASGSEKGGILSSQGHPITVTSTDAGYVGKDSEGHTVFTLTVDASTGHYTYTQFLPLDHADVNDPNDQIQLTFGAKIYDFDGDSADAPIVITVKDDAPIFQPPPPPPENPPENPPVPGNPTPDHGLEVVDETNLVGGHVVETGKLDADFGADVPGSYAFIGGSFAATGSMTNNALTHNGLPVTVALNGSTYTGTASDGTVIFTLELNPSTGDYKFTLLDNLDHADKSNPDDQIQLDFGVVAKDFEGDGANGSIRIIVKDDAPIAHDDHNTYDTTFGVANGNVVTGLNGGPGAADHLSTDGITAGSNDNIVTKVAFGDHVVDVPATGTVSIDGQYGTLTIDHTGAYTYKAFDNGGMIEHGAAKEFVSGPALPDYDESQALSTVEQQSLGVAPGNLSVHGGDTVSVKFVSEQAGYGNTLGVFTVGADGKLHAETILIKDGNAATAGQTFSYTAGSDASSIGFFIVADGNSVNSGYAGIDLAHGTLNFVYDYGQGDARDAQITDNGSHVSLVFTDANGHDTVLNGPLYFTSDRGDTDNLNADGSVRVVSGIPGDDNHTLQIGFEDLPGLGDKDYNDIVFNVSINGKDCGCGDKDINDQFQYTIKDGDGDTSTANLTLNGQDLTDDQPILTTPDVKIVDETDLATTTPTQSGKVIADFGHDGPGTIAANGSFTSGGSQTNGHLSHNGVPVVVALVGDTYVGKAGDLTVFTLKLTNDGSYTFKLYDNLDHANGNDPNDVIDLHFGVSATDCDGDCTNTTITIQVKDDAPTANNDTNHASESGTVAGNVTSNDLPGQDNPATVTKVVFNGHDYTVPATGTVTVVGDFGTLKIDHNGAYSYTANSNNPNGTDQFTYTLQDSDGDKASACLTIDVTCQDDVPTITCAVETVDETNLVSGVITETGSVTANYFSDGPGKVEGNGSFTSGGSQTGGKLSSHGHDVTVTLTGDTYTGKASDGTVVFTLKVETNGDYTYKQYGPLDHANGNDANDIIDLNFGVKATDADGDKADGTITIHVKDDAPIAHNDSNNASEGGTVTGNVTSNDTVGQDTPGTVTKVVFNGHDYTVPATGTVTVTGDYGTLKIDHNGAYSYTANSNNPNGADNFTYTLKDSDGDTSSACLTINVTCKDDVPTITCDVKTVDETDLNAGNLTVTGSVTANYFSDGPGKIEGNGSFTSGGSQTNGALTHNGVPVVVTLNNGIYTGVAGGVTIFTLVIAADGSYTFKQFDNLDHKDGSNPNDIIDLNFGVKATDADGDKADGTITIHVKDDAPIAHDDHNTSTTSPATGNVITGLNGGAGAGDVLSTDAPNHITKVSFGGHTVDVPSTGTATIEGMNGTLKISADGSYTYTAHADGDAHGADKTFVGGPALPDFNEGQALDGVEQQSLGVAKGNLSVGAGDVISVKFDGTSAQYSNTLGIFTVDAQGHLKAETIVIPNAQTASGETHTYTAAAGAAATGFFVIADGANANNNYAGVDLAHGSLDFVYNYGTSSAREATVTDNGANVKLVYTADNGTQTVIQGPVYFTSDRGDVSNLNADGSVRVVSGVPDGDNHTLRIGFEDLPQLGDKDYNDVVFDVSIKNTDCGCDNSDVFTYTLADGDTDTSTATLTLDCIKTDYTPEIITPAAETVDETNLASGVITETGTVSANFFGDGPGTFSGNNSFTSGGSRLADKLTSGGVPVVVTQNGDTYTGTAGGVTVFTMVIAASGAYTFKLLEQLDHKDGTNPNDIIDLNFGVKATDHDGDSAATTITVHVKDDAPIANNDGNSTVTGSSVIHGNVTDNDKVGQDTPGTVTKITFEGTTKDVPANGTVSIVGDHGTLTIDHTGAYTYTTPVDSHAGADNFTYTLKDGDGDTATACLTVNVKDNPIMVCVFSEDQCVKEDGHVAVPVHAYITDGNGNETMAVTLTGVAPGWTITSAGWVNNGDGSYTLTLPKGVSDYTGSLDFKPPANSDADLTGLQFKVTAYDPDTNTTIFATEDVKVIVDAVVDPIKFSAGLTDSADAQGSGKIFTLSDSDRTLNSKLNITNVLHQDNDGSESLKKIVFTIQDGMDNTTFISQKNSDGTFTQIGTKGASGADTTYTIDLTGKTYAQALSYIQNSLYLTNDGPSHLNGNYNLGIQIVSYEKNLSGVEKDYTDNETSYSVVLPVLFCLSPLVIDMNHNGVELLSQDHGVAFDITNDGIKDQTAWVAKTDALLALDKNHDGVINDRSELFGNDNTHNSGFDSLAAYDLNKDGVIDSKDAIFADLKIWQDTNSDGISQASEMKSLHDAHIDSISLASKEVQYDIAGNPITHESTVSFSDGSSSAIVDAWFAYKDGATGGVDKGLTLHGTDGNDVIAGSSGNDDLYGGSGADTFLFKTISEGVDHIKDFNAAEGDKIDLSNVVAHFDPVTDAINDFVFATHNGNATTISVNETGVGGEAAAHIVAVLDNANVNVSDLFNNGSIIV